MKKIVSILICALILMTALCVVASAESTGNNTYTFETEDAHYTVTFESNNLSEEQQSRVAEGLVFGKEDSAVTYGLGCTLFGHDYVYDTVYVITHKVRTTHPRCKQAIYDVTTCEDCDFYEETLIKTQFVDCCA